MLVKRLLRRRFCISLSFLTKLGSRWWMET